MTNAALFLDRDDTLVYDDGYMSRPDQMRLLPGVAEALRKASAHFRLYLVTNQSGIGRGYYTMAEAEACNRRLLELLALPAPGFSGICIAPERPEAPSKYRKPSPAFLTETLERDGLDKTQCYMIGDKTSDLECGLNAGVEALLVGKGTGTPRVDAAAFAEAHGLRVFRTLQAAIDAIVGTAIETADK